MNDERITRAGAPRKDRTLGLILLALAVAWIGVLFFFSGQDGAQSESLSNRVTAWLLGFLIRRGASQQTLNVILRKIAHLSIFFVEGALLAGGLLALWPRRRTIGIHLGACALLSILNELHQSTRIERTCSPKDMLIDFAGAFIGLVLVLLLRKFEKRKEYQS